MEKARPEIEFCTSKEKKVQFIIWIFTLFHAWQELIITETRKKMLNTNSWIFPRQLKQFEGTCDERSCTIDDTTQIPPILITIEATVHRGQLKKVWRSYRITPWWRITKTEKRKHPLISAWRDSAVNEWKKVECFWRLLSRDNPWIQKTAKKLEADAFPTPWSWKMDQWFATT